MQKIDIHLDDIAPEQVSVATSATDNGTQIRIHLAPQEVSANRFEPALSPTMTFDGFVVGESNQFACAAAKAVAEKPGGIYNPVILCGEPGLGKTHLLHAIGNAVRAANPQARVVLTGGEAFIDEFLRALRSGDKTVFREKYTSADLLLFDELLCLAGKERTQEEFLYLFCTLVDAGKQVVITSTVLPNRIDNLDGRIRSRCEYALVADLQPPDEETRLAVLRMFAEQTEGNFSEDVLVYLAAHIPTVRAMGGMAIRLGAYSNVTKEPITLKLAQHLIAQDNLIQSFAKGEDDAQ
jgi:chromosomal replication initiator protein